MSRSTRLTRLLLVVASLAALIIPTARTQAANNSEQVVFSKTFADGTFGPFGYWIWCEASSSNPNAGDCSGSIYFYNITPVAKHVTGRISELVEGQEYQMAVTTANGWSCTLTNVPPVTHGPTNSVEVICSTPSGSGTATGSIVNVTGP